MSFYRRKTLRGATSWTPLKKGFCKYHGVLNAGGTAQTLRRNDVAAMECRPYRRMWRFWEELPEIECQLLAQFVSSCGEFARASFGITREAG